MVTHSVAIWSSRHSVSHSCRLRGLRGLRFAVLGEPIKVLLMPQYFHSIIWIPSLSTTLPRTATVHARFHERDSKPLPSLANRKGISNFATKVTAIRQLPRDRPRGDKHGSTDVIRCVEEIRTESQDRRWVWPTTSRHCQWLRLRVKPRSWGWFSAKSPWQHALEKCRAGTLAVNTK